MAVTVLSSYKDKKIGGSLNYPPGTGAAASFGRNAHFDLWEVPRQLLGLPNTSLQGLQGMFFYYRLGRANCWLLRLKPWQGVD